MNAGQLMAERPLSFEDEASWLVRMDGVRRSLLAQMEEHPHRLYSVDVHDLLLRLADHIEKACEEFRRARGLRVDRVEVDRGRLVGLWDAHDYERVLWEPRR